MRTFGSCVVQAFMANHLVCSRFPFLLLDHDSGHFPWLDQTETDFVFRAAVCFCREALTRPQFLHETALKKAIPLVVIAQQHQCLDAAQEKQLEFIQGKEYVEIKRELQTLFSGSSQGLAGATAAGNMNANAVVATATATASGAAVAAMAVAIPNKPIPTLGAVLPPFQLIKNALNRASPIMAAQSRLLETCLLQMTSTTPQTRIHTITTITHCAGITCQSMPNRRAVLTWFFRKFSARPSVAVANRVSLLSGV